MDIRHTSLLRRFIAALLLTFGLGGCVYAPPYAYDAGYPAYGYPAYGYPTYVGPPVTLDFGFSFYDRPRHHHGRHHEWSHHRGHHGWSHHGRRGRH
ncbi:hypothetical protein LK542_19965 [Massilia sp. IC2-477]|uniref:hypothetical protein n=1 Tax=Massilia sp. IC2-477 TaxID=2887198 RepID=UPI001D10200D|nr:hypothetical protein [Massilia sp. IC2-477]MCC2957899.1 hypothetical protein [Massilia sp. IC2-477]